jgi:hypothetical protein
MILIKKIPRHIKTLQLYTFINKEYFKIVNIGLTNLSNLYISNKQHMENILYVVIRENLFNEYIHDISNYNIGEIRKYMDWDKSDSSIAFITSRVQTKISVTNELYSLMLNCSKENENKIILATISYGIISIIQSDNIIKCNFKTTLFNDNYILESTNPNASIQRISFVLPDSSIISLIEGGKLINTIPFSY